MKRPSINRYADSWFFRWGPVMFGRQGVWTGFSSAGTPPSWHNLLLEVGRVHINWDGKP